MSVKLKHVDPYYASRHGCSYMKEAFDDPDNLVSNAKKALSGLDFDTFVGIGISGALVVPLLGRALGKHFAIVRKEKDGSHSNHAIEGHIGPAVRWIFVDDLIDSGRTLCRAMDVMKHSNHPMHPEFVGAYLYSNYGESEYLSADKCASYIAEGKARDELKTTAPGKREFSNVAELSKALDELKTTAPKAIPLIDPHSFVTVNAIKGDFR